MVTTATNTPGTSYTGLRAAEAEQAVLGSLLLSESAYDAIYGVGERDFAHEYHRTIFRAIVALLDAGKCADPLTVAYLLEQRGELDQCGGRDYIASLATAMPSIANVKYYAAIVRRERVARDVAALAADMGNAISRAEDPFGVAEEAETRLYELHEHSQQSEAVTFAETLDAALLAREQSNAGIPTGFAALDSLLRGLKPGQLIVLAGRPAMGKSALAANIAECVATAGRSAVLFSLEMTVEEIGERILRWHEREIGESGAASRLVTLPLFIDAPASLTVAALRRKLRRLKRKHSIALAVVDYLQLMRGEGENRTQQIGSISRGLKSLAREFAIPIIAVCQLSRAVENRAGNRPQLSDLRESGDIEQDADVVAMIYRDEYYNRDSAASGTAEVLVLKNRNGPTGTVRIAFAGEYARFQSYAGPPIPQATIKRARNPLDFRA